MFVNVCTGSELSNVLLPMVIVENKTASQPMCLWNRHRFVGVWFKMKIGCEPSETNPWLVAASVFRLEMVIL